MRPMPQLRIETVRTSDLLPYAGNAKLHPEWQVEQIAQSIKEFGNNDPIAVWHNSQGEMEIVEGHGRLMALDKLGIQEAEIILLDHLTDEQRRAYELVHNQLTLSSGFDYDMLMAELDKISEIQMEDYGFVRDEIADIDTDELGMGEQDARMVTCPRCGHVQRG